jgi:hypothetical protein
MASREARFPIEDIVEKIITFRKAFSYLDFFKTPRHQLPLPFLTGY